MQQLVNYLFAIKLSSNFLLDSNTLYYLLENYIKFVVLSTFHCACSFQIGDHFAFHQGNNVHKKKLLDQIKFGLHHFQQYFSYIVAVEKIRNVRKVHYLFSMINKKFIKFHDEKYFPISIFCHTFFKYICMLSHSPMINKMADSYTEKI